MIETLPRVSNQMIRAYFRLDFGAERLVACPYFQNKPPRKRMGTAAEVGKGSPEEIIEETTTRAALHWPAFPRASSPEIRLFMIREGIGVDCSGFAARVLDPWIRETSGKPIGKALRASQKGWLHTLRFIARPFHNLDVMTLTSKENCIETEFKDIRPGDLIRTRGGKHVVLISEIEKDGQGVLQSFVYMHSSEAFGEESGVREGRVMVKDPDTPLEQQDWQEVWRGKRPTLEGWMELRERNGIFRLKALA